VTSQGFSTDDDEAMDTTTTTTPTPIIANPFYHHTNQSQPQEVEYCYQGYVGSTTGDDNDDQQQEHQPYYGLVLWMRFESPLVKRRVKQTIFLHSVSNK
jgi:hypothetical protein